MKRLLTGMVLAAGMLLIIGPAIAAGLGDFLAVKKAVVEVEEDALGAELRTRGSVPQDGSGGAFGYGVLTSAGTDAIIVTTTHAGVLDSEAQDGANDPVFHNHFVKLAPNVSGRCGDDLEVVDITFESPGEVDVERREVELDDVPSSFTGTHSLSGAPLTLTPGQDVQNVVSFRLSPKFDGDQLAAVCVTDIRPAQRLRIEADD